MSGIVKGVKKVFKAAVKVVKKAAPYVLMAAAIYFTAGSALGLTSVGWGGAAASAAQSLGLSGTIGNIVTGAITQAGYGAVMGGVTAAVTGGDIGKGITQGALGGAVTGGVTGGLGFNTDPLSGMSGQASMDAAQGLSIPSPAGIDAQVLGPPAGASVSPGSGVLDVGVAGLPGGPTAATTPAAQAVTGAPKNAGFFEPGGWLERNQTLAGNAVKGLGTGLTNYGKASAEAEAIKERQKQIAANYGGAGPGLLTRGATDDLMARQNANEPANVALARKRLYFDPNTNRVVTV